MFLDYGQGDSHTEVHNILLLIVDRLIFSPSIGVDKQNIWEKKIPQWYKYEQFMLRLEAPDLMIL